MVGVRRIQCLSMAKEDEKWYGKKALVGDTIRVFTKLGVVSGVLKKINSVKVEVLCDNDKGRVACLPLSEISSFEVVYRGDNAIRFFSR